jgi:hypothetical protein
MRTETHVLAEAMRILSEEIESPDGVANAAILEASVRLTELESENLRLKVQNAKLQAEKTFCCYGKKEDWSN